VVVALLAGGALVLATVKTNEIKRVDVALSASPNDQPQNFLLVGSDTRDIARTGADDGAIFGGPKNEAPSGQRADTMLVARVDPTKKTVELLSIPRDLWVKHADGSSGRINATYQEGAQTLIDAVQQNLGVPINHYIELNFEGFKGLVSALGGVPMYFSKPMRDANTGLYVKKAGCYNLDPTQALAFARSRHLEYSNGKTWVSDPTGDLGRVTRQQVFLRRSLAKLSTMGISNVGVMRTLVDVGIESVKIDSTLSIDELMSLGQKFSSFNPASMVTHHLPTVGRTTDGGASVLDVDQGAAASVLAIFSGQAEGSAPKAADGPTTAVPGAPAAFTVDVLNGSGQAGKAKEVAGSLASRGYLGGVVGTAGATSKSVVRFADGDSGGAEAISALISPTAETVMDPSLTTGRISVTLGADFSSVAAAASTTTAAPTTTTTAVKNANLPPSEQEIGFVTGDPPAGVRCG